MKQYLFFMCLLSSIFIPYTAYSVKFDPLNVTISPKYQDNTTGKHIESVSITTSRLIIRSIKKNDVNFYIQLFSSSENMTFYLDGLPKSKEWVATRTNTWIERWEQHNPFSAFVIELLNNTPIGHIVVGGGYKEGQASYAIIIDTKHQNNQYGSEAANAIFNFWCPLLKKLNLSVCNGEFCQLHASAVLKNVKSIRILEKNDFKLDPASKKDRLLSSGNTVTEANFYRNYL